MTPTTMTVAEAVRAYLEGHRGGVGGQGSSRQDVSDGAR